MLLYIPIVIYVPALAFSQGKQKCILKFIGTIYEIQFVILVTGINLHLITPIVCVVCIFYTTLVRNSVVIIIESV